MKTFDTRICPVASVCVGLLLLLSPGCGKKQTAASNPLNPEARPLAVSVQTNSFKEVAAHLDPGGSFYLYMGTEQWLDGLSGKIAEWRQAITSLPNASAQDRANLGRLFDVIGGLVKSSGLEEVSAIGASGIQVEKGVYLNKVMVHHYPEKNQGFVWSMFGKAPHALSGLDYLPENTALASWTDMDVPLAWSTLKEQIKQADIPELSKGFEQGTAGIEKQFGVSVDKLIGSLGGEIGFVLTLDANRSVSIPRPNGPKLEIPEPGIAIVLKVKDDTIFKQVDRLMEMNKQVIKTDKDGLKMRSMPLPAPFPLRPTIGMAGEYLFLATTESVVNEMLAVKKGDSKGLKRNPEFKEKSKGIPLEGNSFTYVSPEISRTINHVVETLADYQSATGRRDEGLELIQKLLGDGKETFAFSVGSNTKEGWFMQGNSSQHPATAFLGPVLVAPVAIAASTALPALARAKGQAQTINCVNNMKQIGLAARMYANDHGDVLPKDFESMKAELNSPKVLICPGDQGKAAAKDWASFNFGSVSYEMVTPGAKATDDPQTVYVRCPIHGNVCRLDGSVQQGGRQQRQRQRTTTKQVR